MRSIGTIERLVVLCAVLFCLAYSGPAFARSLACRNTRPAIQTGYASFYASNLAGQPTSSGEPYNASAFTAAHLTLPMNTKILVTNRQNGKSIVLRVNDRGPHTQGRVLDISRAAAYALRMKGLAFVSIRVLCPDHKGNLILPMPKKKPKLG
jgi:rare lipoprotein A